MNENYTISKELLSEVLKYEVCTSGYMKENDTLSVYWGMIGCRAIDDCEEYEEFINIHELANKCKEWLITKDLCVISGNGNLKNQGYFCSIDGFVPTEELVFLAESEVEAIIKATQWFLDNTNHKES